jgi:hypothetical protein
MIYRLLAHIVLTAHLAFVLFVLFGFTLPQPMEEVTIHHLQPPAP